MINKGFYIAFEGVEACGKTTQARALANRLEQTGRKVVLTREPGGTQIGEAIRGVLLIPGVDKAEMEALTEVYLFAAARAQSLREIVKPALERGAIVIADRSVYSNLAYQGFGRELGVDAVWETNLRAVGGIWPDLVILSDISLEVSLMRQKGMEKDRIEREEIDFHKRVREGYLFLAEKEKERFLVVDGSLPIEAQAELIWARISPLLLNDEPQRELQIRRERE